MCISCSLSCCLNENVPIFSSVKVRVLIQSEGTLLLSSHDMLQTDMTHLCRKPDNSSKHFHSDGGEMWGEKKKLFVQTIIHFLGVHSEAPNKNTAALWKHSQMQMFTKMAKRKKKSSRKWWKEEVNVGTYQPSETFPVWIRAGERCLRQCVNMLRGRGCVCGSYRGEQRYNLCLWVQAGWLTVRVSQARPAHSEIYWRALIKHQGRRETPQHTSAGLTRGREWPQGYCTSTRRSSTLIQHRCAEMPLHKCLLTVARKDDGNRLFNVRERFVWSHFTAWVITAIISKSASFRVIMAVTVMQ